MKTYFVTLLLTLLTASFNSYADYQIELAIFEPTSQEAWLTEYWPLLPASLDHGEQDVSFDRRSQTAGSLLNNAVKRLTNSGEYRLLSHFSWQQAADSKGNNSGTTWISTTAHNGLPLQASIKFYKQKFEHIDLSVQIERKIPSSVMAALAAKQQLAISDIGDTWRFNIHEDRKVKPSELQYFDHPMFATLLMIKDLSQP